jgi:hypothetical protein
MEQYIPKAAVVAEIERLRQEHTSKEYCDEAALVLEELEDFLDTLEVKEVDLEDEIERVRKTHFINDDFEKATLEGRQITNIANHFFELGVNASNPLTWEDIKLIWNITDEMDNMPEEEFYKEVLNRFKAQKEE